jgi:hypothetical protein
LGSILGRKCGGRALCDDELDLEANEFVRKRTKKLGFAIVVASLDEQILALDPTAFP